MCPTIRKLAMLSMEARGEHGECLDVRRQDGSTHKCVRQLQCATRCLRCAASRAASQRAGHAKVWRGGHSVGVAIHPARHTLPSSVQLSTARQGGRRRPGSAVWKTVHGSEAAHRAQRAECAHRGAWSPGRPASPWTGSMGPSIHPTSRPAYLPILTSAPGAWQASVATGE